MKKTVIITGGTKGIGAVIARAFYEHEYHVLIGARSDNGLAAGLGPRARFQALDVAKPAELKAMVDTAVQWTGGLDVFINNAGLSGWRSLDKIDESFWQSMLDVNLKSVLFGCQAALGALRPGGVILNISSMAGKRGTANNAAYCAAKFGVNGVTQALAKELGPKGIRVNAICPVLIQTPGLLTALTESPDAPAYAKGVEQFLSDFIRGNAALGRLPSAEEVADFCLYLASEKASAITGQCINLDCGVFPQ